jgi:hypothetical protein
VPLVGLAALVAGLWIAVGHASERRLAEPSPETGGRRRSMRLARLPGLRDPYAALVAKDLALLRREPAVRLLLLQQGGVALAAFALVAWRIGWEPAQQGAAAPRLVAAGLACYPLVLGELLLFLNLLGIEGGGACHLLRTPVDRFRLVLAKLCACLAVFGLANAAAVAALAGFAWSRLEGVAAGTAAAAVGLAALEALCATAVALGAGATGSVLGPFRVASPGRGSPVRGPARGRGLLGSVRAFLGLGLAGLLLAPVALLFHHPALARAAGSADTSGGRWAAAAGAVVLAGVVMLAGAWFAGRTLLRREEPVTARLGAAGG